MTQLVLYTKNKKAECCQTIIIILVLIMNCMLLEFSYVLLLEFPVTTSTSYSCTVHVIPTVCMLT